MKLRDFILDLPTDEEIESDDVEGNEKLGDMEVVIEIQSEKDVTKVSNGQKLTIKEVFRDWHSNVFTIKTDYI